MSKCIFKVIADSLDKTELQSYYQTHLTSEVCKKFNIDQKYFYRIFHYLQIPLRNFSQNKKLSYEKSSEEFKIKNTELLNKHRVKVFTSEIREKISNSNKGIKKHSNKTSFKVGHTPWNKGKVGLQHRSSETTEKYMETMRKNNWWNKKTKIEIEVEYYLIDLFDKDDIIYQYSDKERYPFNCDFYVKSKDLFIEVNYFWTHGTEPFNENNPEHIKKLNEWKEKAKTSKFYNQAIYVWTVLDVKKQQYAKDNKLNYIILYPKDPINLITNSLAI